MKRQYGLLSVLVLPIFLLGSHAQNRTLFDRELLLDAICMVESGKNPRALGDRGRSRGAYQIQKCAWLDSGIQMPYLPNVWDAKKSREVCRRYCEKYAGKNARNEIWARVWNGGPRGHKKKATLPYWKKVEKAMKKLEKRKR